MFIPLLLVGLLAGPTVDQGINCVTGGNCSHTISGEAALNRRNGSKQAAQFCEFYNGTVSWYDGAGFSPESHRAFAQIEREKGVKLDHCERWLVYENGELEAAKAKLIPIDYTTSEWNHSRKHQNR